MADEISGPREDLCITDSDTYIAVDGSVRGGRGEREREAGALTEACVAYKVRS